MTELPDLRDAIYDAPLEERPWKRALEQFRVALDARFVHMSFRPVQEGAVGLGVSASEDDVSTMRRNYSQRFQSLNPMQFERMEAGKVYSVRDFAAEDHAFWTDYLTPSGIGNAYGFLISAGGYQAVIHLVRRSELGDLKPDEVDWWEAHGQSFARAVYVFGELRLGRFVAGLQSQVLDRMALGMMILDQTARVLYSNTAARQIVVSSKHVEFAAGGRLRFIRPDHQTILRHSLARHNNDETRLFCCTDEGNSDRVVEILLARVDAGQDFGLASAPTLVVYLHDRAASPAPSAEFLAGLFGLTQAEARVLSCLAGGDSIADVAIALNLSEHTVRTQTKRLLSKIGVSRQSDLVRLALNSLATIVGDATPV